MCDAQQWHAASQALQGWWLPWLLCCILMSHLCVPSLCPIPTSHPSVSSLCSIPSHPHVIFPHPISMSHPCVTSSCPIPVSYPPHTPCSILVTHPHIPSPCPIPVLQSRVPFLFLSSCPIPVSHSCVPAACPRPTSWPHVPALQMSVARVGHCRAKQRYVSQLDVPCRAALCHAMPCHTVGAQAWQGTGCRPG